MRLGIPPPEPSLPTVRLAPSSLGCLFVISLYSAVIPARLPLLPHCHCLRDHSVSQSHLAQLQAQGRCTQKFCC